ncbi:hypothetical protein, partial [Thiobacillus sp.]|uniref:hypothetical protein n=1 Tax=Thiobacillus sp. TaxID=924 RepID=UPI00286EABFE
SGAQTPLPLIHPAGSIFGGAERGEGQNQGGDDGADYVLVWRRPSTHSAFNRQFAKEVTQFNLRIHLHVSSSA